MALNPLGLAPETTSPLPNPDGVARGLTGRCSNGTRFDDRASAPLFRCPCEPLSHVIATNASAVNAVVDGAWSSKRTIKDYDNRLHQFQLVFESGTGTYSPAGQNLSGTYDLSGAILTIQLANGLGSYPPLQSPGSCTDEGSNRIGNCGLYMKQN